MTDREHAEKLTVVGDLRKAIAGLRDVRLGPVAADVSRLRGLVAILLDLAEHCEIAANRLEASL